MIEEGEHLRSRTWRARQQRALRCLHDDLDPCEVADMFGCPEDE